MWCCHNEKMASVRKSPRPPGSEKRVAESGTMARLSLTTVQNDASVRMSVKGLSGSLEVGWRNDR